MNINGIVSEFEVLEITADLLDSICHLNHGSWVCDDDTAVNSLIIPLGYQESESVYVQDGNISIPICSECEKTLNSNDKDWYLFLCLNCANSSWKIRELTNLESIPLAKRYSDMIILFSSCPHCKK